jgi:hypothetical protein
MNHPPLFDKMMEMWMAQPRVTSAAIADGSAAREPKPGCLPLKGRSTISDILPPEAFAAPATAAVFNRWMRKLHRRIKLSALLSGTSRSEVESHLEVHAQLFAALAGQRLANKSDQIRRGLWAEDMEAWLHQHPSAPYEEELAEARRLVDKYDLAAPP